MDHGLQNLEPDPPLADSGVGFTPSRGPLAPSDLLSESCSDIEVAAPHQADEQSCTALESVNWEMTLEWERVYEHCEWIDLSGITWFTGDEWPTVVADVLDDNSIRLLDGRTGESTGQVTGVDGAAISAVGRLPGSDDVVHAAFRYRDGRSGLGFTSLLDGEHSESELVDDVSYCAPALFDLNSDGVFDAACDRLATRIDGETIGEYPANNENYHITVAGDFDADGDVEVLTRSGIWDAVSGEGDKWVDHELSSIFHLAPVLLDGELFVVGEDRESIFLARLDGTTVWSHALGNEPQHGAWEFSIGDADGDGEPEICLATMTDVRLVSLDGSTERSWPRSSPPAGGGCTLADLDADGDYEVIDASGANGLTIRDGRTGRILAQAGAVSRWTFGGAPAVADIDGDGSAEIILAGGRGEPQDCDLFHPSNDTIQVYGPASGRWSRTRPVWNQRGYDITSVKDDGTIIARPIPSWEAYNSWRAQPAHDGRHPDLTVTAVSACADECEEGVPTSTIYLSVQVSNLGSAEARDGAKVRLLSWTNDDPATLLELASHDIDATIPAAWCRAPQHLVPVPCCLTGLHRPFANPPTLETGISAA